MPYLIEFGILGNSLHPVCDFTLIFANVLFTSSLSSLVATLAKDVVPSENNGMAYVTPSVLDPPVTK